MKKYTAHTYKKNFRLVLRGLKMTSRSFTLEKKHPRERKMIPVVGEMKKVFSPGQFSPTFTTSQKRIYIPEDRAKKEYNSFSQAKPTVKGKPQTHTQKNYFCKLAMLLPPKKWVSDWSAVVGFLIYGWMFINPDWGLYQSKKEASLLPCDIAWSYQCNNPYRSHCALIFYTLLWNSAAI